VKGAKLNENLIDEAIAAINVPPSSLGLRSSSLVGVVSAPFRDEVSKPLLRCGFLHLSGVALPLTGVGESPLSSAQFVGEKILGFGVH
jgi:hypothetical protein